MLLKDVQLFYQSEEPFPGEEFDSESTVETLGYLDVQAQVERAMLAGVKLEAFRGGYYQSDLYSDQMDPADLPVDFTARKDMEFSDVMEYISGLREKALEASRLAELDRTKKAKQDAEALKARIIAEHEAAKTKAMSNEGTPSEGAN